jgi:hypothetical protein
MTHFRLFLVLMAHHAQTHTYVSSDGTGLASGHKPDRPPNVHLPLMSVSCALIGIAGYCCRKHPSHSCLGAFKADYFWVHPQLSGLCASMMAKTTSYHALMHTVPRHRPIPLRLRASFHTQRQSQKIALYTAHRAHGPALATFPVVPLVLCTSRLLLMLLSRSVTPVSVDHHRFSSTNLCTLQGLVSWFTP